MEVGVPQDQGLGLSKTTERKEPAALASFPDQMRPGAGPGGPRMSLQIEHVDGALPDGLALERLFDGQRASSVMNLLALSTLARTIGTMSRVVALSTAADMPRPLTKDDKRLAGLRACEAQGRGPPTFRQPARHQRPQGHFIAGSFSIHFASQLSFSTDIASSQAFTKSDQRSRSCGSPLIFQLLTRSSRRLAVP